jgi:hypothetical protein
VSSGPPSLFAIRYSLFDIGYSLLATSLSAVASASSEVIVIFMGYGHFNSYDKNKVF